MAEITFTIPSVLNRGGGEKKAEISSNSLSDAFVKVSEMMGDDFKRRVLEADGTPRSLINIYINGKNAKFADGLKTALKNGDEIYILPAVAGGSAELSAKELDRFSRQVMLEEIGYNGQLALKKAKVCVVGTGGLGNPILSRLAAMGVGALRIVDRDVIEISNLHRQTMFNENDVGRTKVAVAKKKLQTLNPDCTVEPLEISINDSNASEIVQGCNVVIDALDGVNARYALNRACVDSNIPFVTGAAVGVSGQAFTVLPKKSACYFCMFPELDEDTMPTCSIEGVHPSILSIVGGIQVAEAVKIIIGKEPSLSKRILHIDLENMDFNSTRTFRVDECPVCGTGKIKSAKEGLEEGVSYFLEHHVEELCGRNAGKRTYAITPPKMFALDVDAVITRAKQKGFTVDNQGDLGLSLRTNDFSVSFMNKGSAIVVGASDESDAVLLYKSFLGENAKEISGLDTRD